MNAASQPIRILLLETDTALAAPITEIFHAKGAIRLFSLTVVATLKEAFDEINRQSPDVILADLDPEEEPELVAITRLHQEVPQTPVVAVIADEHKTRALHLLHKGAQSYLLKSQLTADALPTFLLRIIERHAAFKAVRESEERFRLMIEHASDVIFVLDKTGVITFAGPSTERILDIAPDDLLSRNALDFIHRDDRRGFLDPFESAFEKGGTLPSVPFRFRRPDGTWIHLEGKGRVAPDASGKPVCILNSHDVSHRIKMEEELRSLALRDELTGLHNRRSFVTCLDQELKVARREADAKGIYLLFIDLDGFKQINDTLGHKVGDKALVEAARLLKTTFRDADLVARLGGDEFVVFLTSGGEGAHVELLKNRLQDSVEAWNKQEQRQYRLQMSVGVVHHDPKQRGSTEELLKRADELMYQQKRAKKNRSALPEPLQN